MKGGTWTLSVQIHAHAGANQAFTNMPAAETFLFSSSRHIQLCDLSGMTQVRFSVNKQGTAAQAGATLALRYALAFSTDVNDYQDISPTPAVVAVDTTNEILDTGWLDLDPTAQQDDIYLAVIGEGGNGTLDPTFGSIKATFA